MRKRKLLKRIGAVIVMTATLVTSAYANGVTTLAEDYEEGFYYSEEQEPEETEVEEQTTESVAEPTTETVQEEAEVTEEVEDPEDSTEENVPDEEVPERKDGDITYDLARWVSSLGGRDFNEVYKEMVGNEQNPVYDELYTGAEPSVALLSLDNGLFSFTKMLASGDQVYISGRRDVSFTYGGITYDTWQYNIDTGSGILLGFCAESNKLGPTPNAYTAIGDSSGAIKFVIATTDGAPLSYIPTPWNTAGTYAGMTGLIPYGASSDYVFCMTHMIVSMLHCGRVYPFDKSSSYQTNIVNGFRNVASWANEHWQEHAGELSNYNLFVASTGINSAGQPSQDIMWIADVPKGRLAVQKASSNTGITNNNPLYSLQGAVYSVYRGDTHVTDITTNGSGYAETGDLDPGDYTVVETTAPTGYVIDATRFSVHVGAGTTTRVPANGNGVHLEVPKTGKIDIYKRSANTDCTNNNGNYSLEGALYNLYTDAGCTQRIKSVRTDANGYAAFDSLPFGNYYIKEAQPSKGYDLDATVHPVSISNVRGVNVVEVAVESYEPPKLDPVSVVLRKVDSDTGGGAVGSATMEDAHYELKYYADIMTTDPALSGKTPLRTWVLKTTATQKGARLYINDTSKISGDEFWHDQYGGVAFPYGTVTIKEIKAPNGYLINDTMIVVPVTDDIGGNIIQYHEPTQSEVALRINVTKKQSGTDKVIPDATFKHTKPDGTTETLKTDENGQLSFKGLTWGNHVVEEISSPTGYQLNTNKITFNVSNTNKITITSTSRETDYVGRVDVKVGTDGNLNATVYDKPNPYELHISKINDKDMVLGGAEFTLYNNANCTSVFKTAVTDDDGNLTFENMIPGRTYYLKETRAPKGYRIPINADGSDIVYKVAATSFPVDGAFTYHVNDVAYNNRSTGSITVTGDISKWTANMTIVNPIGRKLPATGSSAGLVVVVVGVGLVVTAYVVSKKKKNK